MSYIYKSPHDHAILYVWNGIVWFDGNLTEADSGADLNGRLKLIYNNSKYLYSALSCVILKELLHKTNAILFKKRKW